jgi:peptidoglycan-associated lipoprotein
MAAQAGSDLIYFETNQHDLTAQARGIVEGQARWLMSYPSLNVTIEGHADERGTREYNIALGDRRANAVRNYMVALGVESYRVNTISYGKEQPLVVGSDGSSWSQNRRARTRVD